ncbi:MAG: hypothetical protein ACJ77A_15330 [Actinomycetota bacterium]
MRRSRTPPTGARLWAMCMLGLNLAGATWLSIHMAVVEHEGPVAVMIAVFAVAIVVLNIRAAKKADSVRGRRMVRHGHLLLPEDFGVPEVRFADRIEPPQPKLGAPGSLN